PPAPSGERLSADELPRPIVPLRRGPVEIEIKNVLCTDAEAPFTQLGEAPPMSDPIRPPPPPGPVRSPEPVGLAPTASAMHARALEEIAPPTVLLDDRWNVLQVSPTASRFFQQNAGPPATRVTDLVRSELRHALHALLLRASERP